MRLLCVMLLAVTAALCIQVAAQAQTEVELPAKEGLPRSDVLAKWADNAPLAFVDQQDEAFIKK